MAEVVAEAPFLTLCNTQGDGMDFGQALLNSFQTVLGAAENAAPGWQALQDQQAQRADVQAQTQSRQLGNYEKQMQIAQQKKFQDFQSRMQALGQDSDAPDPKNPDSVADHLAKEGEQYIDSGYINEGSKLLQESTRLRTLNMNARRAGAQAVLEQVKVEKAKNEGAAASLYGVTNEEEFRSAVKGTKLEDMPWEGPTTVQKARERLMSPEFQLKEKEAAAKERDRSEQREIQKKKEQDQVKYWTEQNRIRAEAGKTKWIPSAGLCSNGEFLADMDRSDDRLNLVRADHIQRIGFEQSGQHRRSRQAKGILSSPVMPTHAFLSSPVLLQASPSAEGSCSR